MISFNLDFLLKTFSPHIVILGLGLQHTDFYRTIIQSITAPSSVQVKRNPGNVNPIIWMIAFFWLYYVTVLVHKDPGKGCGTEDLPPYQVRERPKKAGYSSLVINRV